VVATCEKLLLSLEVLGKFLKNKNPMQIWEEILKRLREVALIFNGIKKSYPFLASNSL